MLEQLTLAQFIAAAGLKMSVESAYSNPSMDDSSNMDHWKCVLRIGRRQMTVPFSQGYGHNGREPELSNVLSCLASDSASIENARSFEEWASDFGYDTDSRKAERTFHVCERQAGRLKAFLGSDLYSTLLYSTLLWNTEQE